MAITDEERVLRDADKAYKRRVRDAEADLKSAEEGRLVEQYGTVRSSVKVYADRVVNGGQELALLPDTKVDVQATGAVTGGKDGKTIDSRELYLQVENANGGFTFKCKPDDGERVRALAQKIRLAAPGGQEAAAQRRAAIERASSRLEQTRADRADVVAAEAALDPETVKKMRRRQKFGWVKWVAAGFAALLIIAAIFGGSDKPDTATTAGQVATAVTPPAAAATPPATSTSAPAAPAPPPPPPPPPAPPPSPRARLDDALSSLDAKVIGSSPSSIAIRAQTPEGGFGGTSTGDLNAQAGKIFEAIYGTAGYHRDAAIDFKGGLVSAKTGEDLPDARTGLYRMSRADAAEIDWADSDRLLVIRWSLFREFAHPALKQDENEP